MQLRKLLQVTVVSILLVSMTMQGSSPTPATLSLGAQSVAAQGTPPPPVPLVSGGVTSYSVAGPKVFWRTAAYCPSPPPGLRSPDNADPDSEPQAAEDPEVISRIATVGSEVRQLFNHNPPRSPGVCNPYKVRSNIIADDSYVYWVDASGLVRLPTTANPGNAPQAVAGPLSSRYDIQLVQTATHLYFLLQSSGSRTDLGIVDKASKALSTVTGIGDNAYNLQTDDSYLFFIVNGTLRRMTIGTTDSVAIANNIGAYFPDASRFSCDPRFGCFREHVVFIARGREVVRYSNVTGNTSGAIYTSTDTTANVYQLQSDGKKLYLFESRRYNCGQLFCETNEVLVRTGRGAGEAAEPLYTYPAGLYPSATDLTTDGTFLFWRLRHDERLLRLPSDIAALAQTNMRITAIEVTQAVQRLDNSVLLVRNKRTFVRVHVQSDGPPVEGVTAELYGSWSEGSGGPLSPINNFRGLLFGGRTRLTVVPSPSRLRLDDSFLFQLPWDWTTKSDLRLRAELNPHRYPLQTSYANNSRTVGPLNFHPSPRLAVELFSFGYTLNGTTYYPRQREDVDANISWIRRVYPLSSRTGGFNDPSPGFRPNTRSLLINDLGTRVNQTHADCAKLLTKDAEGKDVDNRNLCASGYIISIMGWLRFFLAIDPSTYVYGMISDSGGFPRGQANGATSVGPTGDSWVGYYAGHEIGHMLAQGHPATGNKECALEGGDPDPAYPHAHIGPDDESVAGFDPGNGLFGIGRAVLGANTAGNTWFDMMAYCQPQWISDTNYRNLYNQMTALNQQVAARPAAASPLAGDWLTVFGNIVPGADTALVNFFRRVDEVGALPARVPGSYTIRLLNAQGNTLADYPFTATATDDSELLNFGEIVSFVPGTTQVRIVRLADEKTLATEFVTAQPPVVSDVALQNAPDPIAGTVTLAWNATDADGNALHFDVLYQRDGAGPFVPLQMGITGTSAAIDTASLAGGSGVFRVVATDGVQSAHADSAPLTVPAKPPQPGILEPSTGTQIHYGQLVNFMAHASDVQDGTVADTALVWTNSKGETLGTGSLLSLADLPFGANEIILSATNSVGLTGSTSVTIHVDDDLQLPGPTLSADPVQLVWHLPSGTTDVQTALLSITNSGGGNLQWTATTDATWITLSAAGGTAPASITVSVDPTGMTEGSIRTANIVVNVAGGEGQAAQSITIPVTLALGAVVDPPETAPTPTVMPTATTPPISTAIPTATTPSAPQLHIYLPLVQR